MSRDWVIDAFGARWSLDTAALTRPEHDRLHELWARCRVEGGSAGDPGVLPFRLTTGDPYAVSRAVTLASLRRRRGSAVLLHAVGLSLADRALALVGASGAGKSTAALTLGRHVGYLSDETVAVEPDGSVSPYPKPVSVITDPRSPWDKHELGPDELGLQEVTGTPHLSAVVVLERDPVHEVPELVEVPLVDGLLAVIAQSSSLPLLDRPLHRLAGLVSGSGGPYVLRYREIADCVDIVRDLLLGPTPPGLGRRAGRERERAAGRDRERAGGRERRGGHTRERQPWTSTPGTSPVPNSPIPPLRTDTPVPNSPIARLRTDTPVANSPIPPLRTDTPVAATATTAPSGLGDGALLERAPWVDAVHGEGGTLVLVGHTQVRLGPVGEVVWRLARRPVTLSQARSAVVRELGIHPDAHRLVAEGVATMLDSGVLRLSR